MTGYEVVVAAPFDAGILYYSQVGGFWTSSDEWQGPVEGVICVCDESLNIPKRDHFGQVRISDFLKLIGSKSLSYIHSSETTNQNFASAALEQNMRVIQEYRRLGPYEMISIVPCKTKLLETIDNEVAHFMSTYTPPNKKEIFLTKLRNLPNYFLDARTAGISTLDIIEQMHVENRSRFGDYVLPKFNTIFNDNIRNYLTDEELAELMILVKHETSSHTLFAALDKKRTGLHDMFLTYLAHL